jgi:hypothetical protein
VVVEDRDRGAARETATGNGRRSGGSGGYFFGALEQMEPFSERPLQGEGDNQQEEEVRIVKEVDLSAASLGFVGTL